MTSQGFTGFNATGTAYETCKQCNGNGIGTYCNVATGDLIPCPWCSGAGRVPVPMRGLLDTDETEEREEGLRRKLALCRKALEAVRDIKLNSDRAESKGSQPYTLLFVWCEVGTAVEEALEALK